MAAVKADYVGPQLESWACGAAAVVGKFTYGLPSHASRVVRINGCTQEVDLVGPEVPGRSSYLAAVAVGGAVFGIPYGAPRVMRIDGDSGEVAFIGPEMAGACKYRCACCLGERIYAIPYNAPQVMRIDCGTGHVSFVGPVLEGGAKYSSVAAVDAEGRGGGAGGRAYAPPASAQRVLRIRVDGDAEQVELIGPDLGAGPRKYGCVAALGPQVYALPDLAERILRVAPGAGDGVDDCSFVGPHFASSKALYRSAAIVGGRLYGVPLLAAARNVLLVEAGGGGGEKVDLVGPGSETGGEYRASAVVGRRGYALPIGSTSQLLRIGGDAGRVEREGIGSTECSFLCAAVLHGAIYAFPFEPGRILRLRPPFPQRGANRWGVGVADGPTGTGAPPLLPEGFRPLGDAVQCLERLTLGDGSKVAELAQGAAAVAPPEKRGDVMVIYAFTLESDLFPEVATAMRRGDGGRPSRWAEYIYHLDKALRQQPCFAGTVFRGVDALVPRAGYEPNTEVTWRGFSSATRDAMVLVNQGSLKVIDGGGLSGTVFVIEARTARRVEHVSFHRDEAEAIFVPGTRFRVRSVVIDEEEKAMLLPAFEAYDLRKLQVFSMEECS